MKRSRLSYDDWKGIEEKIVYEKDVKTSFFQGHIELLEIQKVTNPQIWNFNGDGIVVCDKGLKWLAILPEKDYYCITALMNERDEMLLWYIDMIAEQGVDSDGISYFDDLYLDLVVYPDGKIVVDDRDELEQALQEKDITEQQYELALQTSENLQNGLLADIEKFKEYTYQCLNLVREN